MAVAPDAIEGWVGEAETLRQLGRPSQAEGVVARASERFGDVPALRLLRAREQVERGEWLEAEALLAPLAGSPDAGARLRGLGLDRHRAHRSRRLDGAREAARAALAIDRDDAVARYALQMIPAVTRLFVVQAVVRPR